MSFFDDIRPGAEIKGLDPAGMPEIVAVSAFGADAVNLVFRVDGRRGQRLLSRGEEAGLEWIENGRSFPFDADGELLRLASETYRIRLAYLFDPYLAVSASRQPGRAAAGEMARKFGLHSDQLTRDGVEASAWVIPLSRVSAKARHSFRAGFGSPKGRRIGAESDRGRSLTTCG